jgi:hypothetical protein
MTFAVGCSLILMSLLLLPDHFMGLLYYCTPAGGHHIDVFVTQKFAIALDKFRAQYWLYA